MRFLSMVMVVILLSGCATPMVMSLVKQPDHYIPPATTDKGLIYIYRSGELTGSLRGIYILADGKRIGGLNSGTYFVYEADPGEITISCDDWLGENPSRTLTVEAGKSYYLRAGVKFGLWDADLYITIVHNTEGEQAIKECKYAVMKEKDKDK